MYDTFKTVRQYIKDSWCKAVKSWDCVAGFPLPYDYIPPCVDGDLTNLYYWDTYFTNKGLYLDGLDVYAYHNIEVLKFCLRKFGCVPNMCRANGADYASQPPLLFLMVQDYYARSGDKVFLADSYDALQLEYAFWMGKRISDNGLNCYGFNWDFRHNGTNIDYYVGRLGLDITGWSDDDIAEKCENLTAEGESGQDFTPRFCGCAKYINPVDLNTYLYAFETTMSDFSKLLHKQDEALWQGRAARRKDLMDTYCLDKESGLYFDYNYKSKRLNKVYCVDGYLPFLFGLIENKEAIDRLNQKLICSHGVASCQEITEKKELYQWGYPNAWAPHQYWAYMANQAAGKEETAISIATMYMENVARVFMDVGKIYEKYDALTGGKAVVNEYGLPEMLGWSAGVYNVFYDALKHTTQ